MKPSRLLLIWLAILLAIGIVLGALQALDVEVPSSLLSINWGLLLALFALSLLDALRLRRLPSPRVQRQMPGSLALGRWSEVRLEIEHDFDQPLAIQIFDHVPDGLSFENLPLDTEPQPGERSLIGYRLRPLKSDHPFRVRSGRPRGYSACPRSFNKTSRTLTESFKVRSSKR